MREEIDFLGGIRKWNETRESWLAQIPKIVRKTLGTEKETVSYRMVKSFWYGEITNEDHHAARDMRRAVEILKARKQALELAKQYQKLIGGLSELDQNSFSSDIARLERVVSLLCGRNSS